MKRLKLLPVVLLGGAIFINGSSQIGAQRLREVPINTEELELVSELQSLSLRSAALTSPLARARAKAEVASALWYLDREEAKRILLDAYTLTLPDEEEQQKKRAKPVGADNDFPSEMERARTEVRNRVLKVAGRDPSYSSRLVKLAAQTLGSHEAHISNSILAGQALSAGDTKAAGQYVDEALEAEPTQTSGPLLIQQIAKKDRAAADVLIINYIDHLRRIQFSNSQSMQRIYFVLLQLVFPTSFGMNLGMNDQGQVQPPGVAVMKAYASYIIQSLGQLVQTDPGALIRLRGVILTAGQPTSAYMPELMPAYLQLEQLSRGDRAGNPIQTPEDILESTQRNQQQQLDAALEKETIDASLIEPAVARGMFDKARKAAENLPEGDRKTQLTDLINAQEALSFVARGNIAGAERLAGRLRTPSRVFEVYSALVKKCGENRPCKIPLLYRALDQLKASETIRPTGEDNLPSRIATTTRESDPKAWFLSRLAQVAVSVDDILARASLADLVSAINHTTVATELGKLGFEVELFSLYAQKNETDAQLLAASVTEPFRRIAALSAINEWKAKKLKEKDAKTQLLKKSH